MFSKKALMDIKKSNKKNLYHDQALEVGTRLFNESYEILELESVLNSCLIYKALKISTSEEVCIKEFFPNLQSGLSHKKNITRNIQTKALEVNKEGLALDFDYEFQMKRFLMKHKHHKNITLNNNFEKVKESFYENNTVYIVFPYNVWPNLGDFLESDMPLSFKLMDDLVFDLLKETITYHKKGLIHGAICPQNIYLHERGLFLKPQSDIELNHKDYSDGDYNPYKDPDYILTQAAIGPYLDVYAIGKVMIDLLLKMASTRDYFNALGKIPNESDRIRYESTIKKAVAFKVSNRIKDASALKNALFENMYLKNKEKIMKETMALILIIAALSSLMVLWSYQ